MGTITLRHPAVAGQFYPRNSKTLLDDLKSYLSPPAETVRAMGCIVPQGTTYLPPGQRPDPFVGNGTQWFDQGTSSYHSLNVSLLKRASHGLTFKANYTYSKVIDLNSAILAPSGGNEPPDVFSPYNLFLNRGPASYSLQHQFNANYSYQLPFGTGQHFGAGAHGLLNQLIGRFQYFRDR